MLTDDQVRMMLDQLCVDLGFCLPPAQIERLARDPPTDVVPFTDEVFRAEGLDPETADRRLYRRVHDVVARAFERAAGAQEARVGRLPAVEAAAPARRVASARSSGSGPTGAPRASVLPGRDGAARLNDSGCLARRLAHPYSAAYRPAP